jgi:hypothetical protein
MSRGSLQSTKELFAQLIADSEPLRLLCVPPGQNPGDIQLQAVVEQEFAQYKDLVQGNFIDSYFNNTWKTALGLRWAVEHCPKEGNITVPQH